MAENPTYEELKQRVSELEQQNELLQAEATKYRTLFYSFPHGITVSDSHGDIVEANSISEQLLGISKDQHQKRDIAGQEWRIIRKDGTDMPPDEWASVIALKEKRMVTGCEMGLVKTDGQTTWINVTAAPLQIEGYGVVITYNDITKNIQAEAELRQSEELLSEMARQVPGLLYQFYTRPNGEMGMYYVSERSEQIVGLQPNLDGFFDRFTEIIVPEHREDFIKSIEKAVKEKSPWHFEGMLKKLTGEQIWFSGHSVPSVREGEVVFNGIVQDITERKQAEEAIRKSEQEKSLILNNASEIIAFHNKDRRLIWANRAYLDGITRIIGLPVTIDDLKGKKCHEAWGLTGDCTNCPVLLAIETGKPQEGELTPENQEHWPATQGSWMVRAAPVRDSSGAVVGVIEIANDITERKQAEKERERLQTQLTQAQKMESIGTLAGGIAHDFNNALTPIMVQTELAKLTIPADNPVQEGLDEIIKAGHRAKDLVKQILTYSRQSQQQRVSIDLTPMIKESLKLLRSSIPTTIEIRQDIETDPCTVLADPTQMEQIVMNLCTNASQAMQEMGSVLEVSLKPVELDEDEAKSYPNIRAGSYVMLTVSDTGIGIEAELMEKIFDPFFTTKPVNEGTGMGLSVVHGIVLSHQGDITVRSEPGKGATFTVLLPRLEQETETESETIDGSLPTGNERVMFVDDEDPMVKAGEQMLKQLGYQVEVKTSAVEALAAFLEQPDRYDLVMTDMSMPNMTGDNLAKAMMNVRPDIPVIICTGFSHQIDEEKALAMGIRAFVMKPFAMKGIAETVRKVLDVAVKNR